MLFLTMQDSDINEKDVLILWVIDAFCIQKSRSVNFMAEDA